MSQSGGNVESQKPEHLRSVCPSVSPICKFDLSAVRCERQTGHKGMHLGYPETEPTFHYARYWDDERNVR